MRCSFCNENIEAGTGKMFVRNDGKVFYFCSGKCEKNMLKLRREPKDVKWVTKKKAKK
ncbi:MAG: 50S ribosomal protein L24e [Candidatus Aenigmarchaeota archaeon]|nr:50S ribosomal protein L24e [Candidatus Aenigmarchaeota archaeon]